MPEGHAGEVKAPAESQTAAEDTWQTLVAAVLATVEAAEGQSPDTVTGVDAIWLTEQVFKCHPDMFVNIIRIPQIQVWSVVSDLSYPLSDSLSYPLSYSLSQTHC